MKTRQQRQAAAAAQLATSWEARQRKLRAQLAELQRRIERIEGDDNAAGELVLSA